MYSTIGSKIIGTGSYLPETMITNSDLEKLVDTDNTWILERTGISTRYRASVEEQTSDLATNASKHAIEMADISPDMIDAIIVGTVSSDYRMPSCAVMVQEKLKATNSFAFDISAACAGSLYGLKLANDMICNRGAKTVLVIGAEILTRLVDWKDRSTCVLFGDGAGATILTAHELSSSSDSRFLSHHFRSDGSLHDILSIPAGGTQFPLTETNLGSREQFINMNGKEVFKTAVKHLTISLQHVLDAEKMKASDIDFLIAHQANMRIIDAVLKKVDIPKEKCWINLDRYGNTSAASLPITLDEVNRANKLHRGDTIAMMAIGAGMTWGSILIRW